ncbi:39S ribosomal protein L54, mitochondrial-like [Haliotis rubra]|uniref:39S ribosomal protein L54, mitochondrial-like n=1 Tax=Haliotis rubra TaxID=36100 RepID=UPI001EE5A59D|nr:39S ribosomal protein L54, mitochondrial-like [Haliotis rubra]
MAACIRCACALAKINLLSVGKTSVSKISVANYAKKMAGKGGAKMGAQRVAKVLLEVETDAAKLTNYCCGANIDVHGKDPELKADSEYPDWLWSLRTERSPPKLSEYEEDSLEMWRRKKKLALRRKNHLRSIEDIKS